VTSINRARRLSRFRETKRFALVKGKYAAWQGIGVFQFALAPAGKPYFETVSGEAMTNPNPFTQPLVITLKAAIRPKIIEITGIRGDQPTTKIVEYKWRWEVGGLPEDLKSLLPTIAAPHDDKRTFQLYDDGWRMVN
jgi:hypothetical protein